MSLNFDSEINEGHLLIQIESRTVLFTQLKKIMFFHLIVIFWSVLI